MQDYRVQVNEAAKLLGVSGQCVRIGLQRGIFPFGYAIKTSTQYTYHISRHKLNEYLGIKENTVIKTL